MGEAPGTPSRSEYASAPGASFSESETERVLRERLAFRRRCLGCTGLHRQVESHR
jgi:hypothetical protein